MNEKVLLSHPGGRKHKERLEDCEQVKSFFRPKNATDITFVTWEKSEKVRGLGEYLKV